MILESLDVEYNLPLEAWREKIDFNLCYDPTDSLLVTNGHCKMEDIVNK